MGEVKVHQNSVRFTCMHRGNSKRNVEDTQDRLGDGPLQVSKADMSRARREESSILKWAPFEMQKVDSGPMSPDPFGE